MEKAETFDVAAWFATLDQYLDEPFMPDGRQQPTMPPPRIVFDEMIRLDTNAVIAAAAEHNGGRAADFLTVPNCAAAGVEHRRRHRRTNTARPSYSISSSAIATRW